MKIFKSLLVFLCIGGLQFAHAQSDLTSNNKTLAIFNPALQNYSYDFMTFTNSVYMSPTSDIDDYINYTSALEFNFDDRLRLGAHASKAETRLNRYDAYKVYGSYAFKSEAGAIFTLGIEGGYYSDYAKTGEFNKVWGPNHFVYADSNITGFDIGAGMSIKKKGFTFGFAMSKLNQPNFIPFPQPYLEPREVDGDTFNARVDTTILYPSNYLEKAGLNTTFHFIYEWDINEELSMTHIAHFRNPDFAGIDYFGFQTFLLSENKFSAGAGVMYNENTVYMLSGGITFLEKLSLEVSAFFVEESEFRSDGDIYHEPGEGYVNMGKKPRFEFNLRLDL
ncbi:type IX secretion system membrane protein PorP/SprF [bacterium]|nr:type IX secretion system membrane protein PorP/SprF [bacterium]